MIDETTLTKDWILAKSDKFKIKKRKADPELIEKVTKALYLLENLIKADLKFIFKGGTSLLLLLDEMHRFSIDIDIIIESKKKEIDLSQIFSTIVKNNSVFKYFEKDNRKETNEIPKAHYKFYYESIIDKTDKYILLDILFEKNSYINLIYKNIDCRFVNVIEPEIKVCIPSIDCILGDKLTAYAPNTTGIQYGKGKELEIIKQLFDISILFDQMENINIVSKTFIKMVKQELIYRGKHEKNSYKDVLDDIFETSWILSERGRIEKDIFKQLQTGVKRIKNYIFSNNYIVESAVNSASKAAYLSLLIKYSITDVEKYDKSIDLRTYVIDHDKYKKLKTILKFDPEAYFYWFKSIEILKKHTDFK
ncbi:MAG: nucleotidyl transferase AbiEii/AbiGii toxin family protein [Candidatus Muirbacterium halophilum]|nr:nucleotidyl transferase AbiEii/AbiGii toxin family protein [Candidatus Muirbacterium halophilum]MCK9474937.1 nucleotidyl transferase AbiEii/AbiGii toxin family protein [Candidatus Muirbacterium halophilum]